MDDKRAKEIMKRFLAAILVFLGGIGSGAPACARNIEAIVTTDWLARNLARENLVVVDIRTPSQFSQGHIPGSLSVPLNLWAITDKDLSLQLPSEDALKNLLRKSGISSESLVVVAGRSETDFGRADMTRVAWTLAISGIMNTAVLDGGYTQWAREKQAVSSAAAVAKLSDYSSGINRSAIASKAYVLGRIGKSIIADNRIPEEYFGAKSKPGHIKSAVNLPTPWVFNTDGTYRSKKDIQAMASGVLGTNTSREIILYCGVGGYASTWWFLLTQVLGYTNVKLYDGSMEEWTRDPIAPVATYTWH
jgi:thiosulfate/3-mercaptopyruvate sulfurtransferase